MTITETQTGLEASEEALRAKECEIEETGHRLNALRGQRQDRAIQGSDTSSVKREIEEAATALEEMEMQRQHLAARYEEEKDLALHRERHAALTDVYRTDLLFLTARRQVLVKQAELAMSKATLQQVADDLGERIGQGHGCNYLQIRDYGRRLGELGVEMFPKAPVPIVPMGGIHNNGGDTVAEIDADIRRIANLAAEAEREATC